MAADLILIAYDGSENSKRAVQYAGRFLESCRAVVVTAWEPMVRQAARMSGLSGVMQPEWVPDEDNEDVAFSDAKVTNREGLELANSLGLHARVAPSRSSTRCGRLSSRPPTNWTSTSSSPVLAAPRGYVLCCSPRSPITCSGTATDLS